jgi:hypothetical protein
MLQAVAAAGVERHLVAVLQKGTYKARGGALRVLHQLLLEEPLRPWALPAVVAAGGLEALVKLVRAGEDTPERLKAASTLCLAAMSDEALARRAGGGGAVLPLAQLASQEVDPVDKGLVASCLALVLQPDGTRPELAELALRAGALEGLQQMVRDGRDAVQVPALCALTNMMVGVMPSLYGQAPSSQQLQQME